MKKPVFKKYYHHYLGMDGSVIRIKGNQRPRCPTYFKSWEYEQFQTPFWRKKSKLVSEEISWPVLNKMIYLGRIPA